MNERMLTEEDRRRNTQAGHNPRDPIPL